MAHLPPGRRRHRRALRLRNRRRHPAAHLYDCLCRGTPESGPGVNLLYFLPTAATALPAHIKNGYIDRQTVWPAVLAGLAGTALAAWAATGLDVELLHRCFGGFLIVVGLRELFSRS